MLSFFKNMLSFFKNMLSFFKMSYISVVWNVFSFDRYIQVDDFRLLLNGCRVDIRREWSVLLEWPRNWLGLRSRREISQRCIKRKNQELQHMTGFS
jgi:hypothetical protein